jgi:ELWxxDGT repeat protein
LRKETKYVAEALEPRLLLTAAVLVKDINPDTVASAPSAGFTLGSKSFFTADDGVSGREVWVSDGTSAGTTLLKDIRAGATGSSPILLGILNNALYISASNGTGTQLWRSDGTAAGTVSVKEMGSALRNFQVFNGVGYFISSNTNALWKTDGTAAGTQLVDNSLIFNSILVANNLLYFVARNTANGTELWSSNGTVAGEVLLEVDPGPGNATPVMLTPAGGQLFFRAFDGTDTALWKTNGTPQGTVKVVTIQSIENLTGLNDLVLFQGFTDATRLWRSDGTPEGTYPISDAAPIYASGTTPFAEANGLIFYERAVGSVNDGHEGLWKSDGTAAGTAMVMPYDVPDSIGGFEPVGNNIFFAFSHSGNLELWKSDGTVDGTVLVSSPFRQIGAPIAQLGSQTLYSLADHRGLELWKTDGTAAGTSIVKDINATPLGSDPKALVDVNGTLFFTASNGVWKSDGTAAGTVLVKALDPLFTSTHERDAGVNLNGQYIFTANNQLWRSDGTAQGTILLKSNIPTNLDLGPTTPPSELFATNGYALFDGITQNGNMQLWRTDGTVAGTSLLMDFTGVNNFPSNFTLFNGFVYFTPVRRSTPNNTSLWKTDGTPQGTVMVNPSVSVMRPVEYKQKLWYSGCDTVSGCEPWTTDGNGPGTKFTELYTGLSGSKPSDFVVSNGMLYFSAENSASRGLWKTDGTVNGTKIVGLINNPTNVNGTIFGTINSRILTYNGSFQATIQGPTGTQANITAGNGILFFTNGSSIWISDGSTAGTVKLADQPVPLFDPARLVLTTFNNAVYFRAVDPVLGNELFKLTPPIARTSGPYTIGIGNNVTLEASSSFDPDSSATLSFAWDLDNDGIFGETGSAAAMGDEIGPKPTFKSASIAAGSYPVSLRVTNTLGFTSQLSTTVIVRTSRFIGTPGNDVFRVMLVGDHVDFYENVPAGGVPTFSIPLGKFSVVFVDPSDGNDTFMTNYRPFLQYIGGAGRDTFIATGGDWLFGDISSMGIGSFAVGGNATMLFQLAQHLDSLSIFDTAKVKSDAGARVFRVHSLSIQDNGMLDITSNPLVVDTGGLEGIRALIKSNQLFSSSNIAGRVIGAIINRNDAGGPLYSTFGGENLAGGEILVRYTTIGDVNLDNQVSISDFIDLAAHIGQWPATWQDGDLNGDDAVSIADFIILSSNFEQGAQTPAEAPLASALTTATGKRRKLGRVYHISPARRQSRPVLLAKGWAEKR